jgi:hypothetical protein
VSGNSRFTVGEGYAVYRGPTTAVTLHRHSAFQIVIGTRDAVAVVDASYVRHRAVALVVPPMERHCVLATPDVLTYFVEPHCVHARGAVPPDVGPEPSPGRCARRRRWV